jgi:hypothetical protein
VVHALGFDPRRPTVVVGVGAGAARREQQLLELALPWKNMEGSLVNANQVML